MKFFSVGNGESNWIVGAVTDDLGRTTVLARIGNDSLRLTLALPSVSPEDSGQYLCSPSNMAPVSASLHVVIGNCMAPILFFLLFAFTPPLFFFYFSFLFPILLAPFIFISAISISFSSPPPFVVFSFPLFSICVIDLITNCWPPWPMLRNLPTKFFLRHL